MNNFNMNNRGGSAAIYPGSFLSNIEAACDAANKECKIIPRTEEELAEFRRAANRRSAKQSREKRKAETDKLAREADLLLKENNQLKRENAELRNQVDLLMKALNERTQSATASFMNNNSNSTVPIITNTTTTSNIAADVPASNSDIDVEDAKNSIEAFNNNGTPAIETPASVIEAPTSSSEVVSPHVSPPYRCARRQSVSFDADDKSILKILMEEEEEEQDKPREEITNDEAQQQIEPEPLCNVINNKNMNSLGDGDKAESQIEPEPLCNVARNKNNTNSQLLSQLPFNFERMWQQQVMTNKADLFCGNTGPTQAAAMINAASYHNARASGMNNVGPGAYGKPNKKRARAA